VEVDVLTESNIIEPWVSTKEIAEHLGVTMETVRKWIKLETIPCSRMGKLWKFKKSEVDAWVKSGGAGDEKNN
jgi:excisionase family DNA binding protein